MTLPTATEIAAGVRSGQLEPRDVLTPWLERIERHERLLGAFRHLDVDGALAQADALASRPDRADLPLAGVPIAIKDNIDLAGVATRNGSAATPDVPAPADHPAVLRLRQAGAVIVGKTNVPELCIYPMTEGVYGVTRNPWDPSRTAGGSSGGSGAAVGGGLVPIAQGSDGLGSIRIPSAACGVVGLKPGAGVVPKQPGEHDWFGLTDHGPIGTTVEDVALMLAVMAARPELAQVSPPDASLRVAVSTKSPVQGMYADKEWVRAARHAANLLLHAGHRVEKADPPYGLSLSNVALGLWFAGAADEAQGLDRARLHRRTRTHTALGPVATRLGLTKDERRAAWRERATRFFADHDVLLTPTLARTPPAALRWSERGWSRNVLASTRYAPFPGPWNLAGFPAIAVPAGLHSDGLPLSVQLVAPPGGEGLLLSLARQLEQLAPWPRVAPGL